MSDPTEMAVTAQEPFFEENAGLKPSLKLKFVDREHMEKKAEVMAKAGLNMTQLNRFFRHCRRIEFRLRREESTWDVEKSEVGLLCAHAADAYKKKPPKIPKEFKDFIDENVARIHTRDDYVKGFMKHFEALMGFASLYARSGEEKEDETDIHTQN